MPRGVPLRPWRPALLAAAIVLLGTAAGLLATPSPTVLAVTAPGPHASGTPTAHRSVRFLASPNGTNGTWVDLSSFQASAPQARQSFGMTFDPLMGAVVLFGGQDGSGNALGDTWIYSGDGWQAFLGSPNASQPAPRWGVAMTYDPTEHGVLLFGGRDQYGTLYNDTWLFTSSGWTQLLTTNAPPPGHGQNELVYDATDHYDVFAGAPGVGTWNFSSGTWSNITASVTGNLPVTLGFFGAYDAQDGYAVFYGGTSAGCVGEGLTYTYVGGTWTNITATAGSPPTATMGSSAFTFESWRKAVVLFGGYSGGCTAENQTWQFEGGAWQQVSVPGVSPSVVWGAGMADDGSIGGAVLFGGNVAAIGGSTSLVRSTWALDLQGLAAETSAAPAQGEVPLTVNFTARLVGNTTGPLAFNWSFGDGSPNATTPNASHVYTQRGYYTAGFRVVNPAGYSATASFAISASPAPRGNWTSIPIGASGAPTPRQALTMEYDPLLGATILFGGQTTFGGALGDTWEFVNDSWTDLTGTLGTSPSPRWGGAMVYDPKAGGLLLFGGRDATGTHFSDTWLFNASGWTNLSLSVHPPADNTDGRMVYDQADGYVLLLSTTNGSVTDWTFSGGKWSNITATVRGAPPARGYTAAYDQADQYAVYFGAETYGCTGSGSTWIYSAGRWTNISSTAGSPPQVDGAGGITYDPIEKAVLAFSGYDNQCDIVDQTWGFSNGSWYSLTPPAALQPPGRWDGRLAFDPAIGGDLLSDGNENSVGGSNSFFNDTWVYFDGIHVTARVVPALGVVPASINFSAIVLAGGGSPLSYNWSFGDGTPNGTLAEVNHTYLASGSYAVALMVNDSTGRFGTALASVNLYPNPEASPGAAPAVGEAPLTVTFHANASGGVPLLSYAWQFGDGGTSAAANPVHTYVTGGDFEWNLTVTDGQGHTVVRHGNLTVYPALALVAAATHADGAIPLHVEFSARPTEGEAPYSYHWDFGDGAVGPDANVTNHTYTRAGAYTVYLNVTDQAGAVRRMTFAIVAVPAVVPGGTASSTQGVVPLRVTFLAGPSGGEAPFGFLWTFGDGSGNATGQSVVHTYTSAGTFTAQLSVSDAFGDVANETFTIAAVSPLTASLGVSAIQGLAPLADRFTAAPAGGLGPYGFTFRFGDGASVTGATDVNHTYSVPGRYDASVTVSDAVGEIVVRSATITVAAVPAVTLSANLTQVPWGGGFIVSSHATGGFAPFTYQWSGLPGGCAAGNVSTVTCQPTSAGNFTVHLTATDSAGNSANASIAILVETPPTPPPAAASGFLSTGLLVGLGAVAAAAVVGVGLLLARRRRRPPNEDPEATAAGDVPAEEYPDPPESP